MQRKTMALINHFCLIILATIATTGALVYTKAVLVPFVFSIFFYAVLTPIISWMQYRLKLNRALAVSVTLLLFLAFSAGMILILTSSIEEFLQGADLYRKKIFDLVGWISDKANDYGYELNRAIVKKYILGLPIFSYATNLTGLVFSFVGNALLVIVFVLFLVVGENKNPDQSSAMMEKILHQISSYVSTKTATSFATAILVGAVLYGFGVDLALMFATLTFAFNFIPNIGSIVATLIPLPVIVLQFGMGWRFFLIMGLCSLIQSLIGNYIEPKIMGESLDLHPVTILVFLMFWGLIWGLSGLFLAVPITAIVKMVFAKIETTQPLAELLAGRFPNTMQR
ncbi:MAG: AI-2E family transporter [Bdellovibrionota bacterium]